MDRKKWTGKWVGRKIVNTHPINTLFEDNQNALRRLGDVPSDPRRRADNEERSRHHRLATVATATVATGKTVGTDAVAERLMGTRAGLGKSWQKGYTLSVVAFATRTVRRTSL